MVIIDRKIDELNSINGAYMGFRLEYNGKDNLTGLVKFKTSTGEVNIYNLFETNTIYNGDYS